MNKKELECLGVALKALMDAKMYDAVAAVINIMANKSEEADDGNEEA